MKPVSHLVCLSSALALFAGACVTVNVNFPESAAQKATDDYVRDLYRAKNRDKSPSPEASIKSSLIEWALPSAYADETFSLNSSTIMSIKESQKARAEEVLDYKAKGFIGEKQDGLLAVRPGPDLKPLLQKKIEKLVADENKDREKLYNATLKENKLAPNRITNVRETFSRSFQAESPSGTWVESGGTWAKKP